MNNFFQIYRRNPLVHSLYSQSDNYIAAPGEGKILLDNDGEGLEDNSGDFLLDNG